VHDEILGGQFCAIFRGKRDWEIERPGGQISTFLDVIEIWLREGTGGNICVVIEVEGS